MKNLKFLLLLMIALSISSQDSLSAKGNTLQPEYTNDASFHNKSIKIESKDSGKFLASGNNLGNNKYNIVQQESPHHFKFILEGDSYIIKSASDQYLTAQDGNNVIATYSYETIKYQRWKVSDKGDGYYMLICLAHDGKAIDINRETNSAILWKIHGNDNQLFKLIEKCDRGGSSSPNFTGSSNQSLPYYKQANENKSYFSNEGRPQKWIKDATQKWMGKISGEKQLHKLSIPGTHDSAATRGGPGAKCQSWSITDQLKAGIRFFDIRCRAEGSIWQIYHGISNQQINFGQIMEEIKRFLDQNPSEALIMKIREDERDPKKGSKSHQEIWCNYMSKYGHRFYEGTKQPKLKDVRGKIFLLNGYQGIHVNVKEQESYHILTLPNRGTHDPDNKHNPMGINQKKERIKEFLDKAHSHSDFTPHWVTNGLNGAVGLMPYYVARRTNEVAYNQISGMSGPRRLGVVVMDFPGEGLIYNIIRTNFSSRVVKLTLKNSAGFVPKFTIKSPNYNETITAGTAPWSTTVSIPLQSGQSYQVKASPRSAPNYGDYLGTINKTTSGQVTAKGILKVIKKQKQNANNRARIVNE